MLPLSPFQRSNRRIGNRSIAVPDCGCRGVARNASSSLAAPSLPVHHAAGWERPSAAGVTTWVDACRGRWPGGVAGGRALLPTRIVRRKRAACRCGEDWKIRRTLRPGLLVQSIAAAIRNFGAAGEQFRGHFEGLYRLFPGSPHFRVKLGTEVSPRSTPTAASGFGSALPSNASVPMITLKCGEPIPYAP